MVEHNLEKEKKLLDLLGYTLVGPNNSNRWIILDENQKEVGYIQYKKLYGGNVKKGKPKIFGYQTFIDSSKIKYDSTRELVDEEYKDTYYQFDIKRTDQDVDHVEMYDGSLHVWSKDYGFISFMISSNGLYLNFKRQTDKFNIEELLTYRNSNDMDDWKEYAYQKGYCPKEIELSDSSSEGRTTLEVSAVEYPHDREHLTISRKKWVEGELKFKEEKTIAGTIAERAARHKFGIKSFNRFRTIINQIMPFQKDILSILVTEDMINQYNLSIYFGSPEKENQLHSFQKKLGSQL